MELLKLLILILGNSVMSSISQYLNILSRTYKISILVNINNYLNTKNNNYSNFLIVLCKYNNYNYILDILISFSLFNILI